MVAARKPFQGVMNVVRFNWHFYIIAGSVILSLLVGAWYVDDIWRLLLLAVAAIAAFTLTVSLLATYYIYDLSDLYNFTWLKRYQPHSGDAILNVNAGFDETSDLLADKFPEASLHVADFYDPNLHTEVSIKRARIAYPPHPGTVNVETASLPYEDDAFDMIFVIFAAHEIRNSEERRQFFRELKRVSKPKARIFVTEHLRDLSNFLVYTIGFMHFYSHKEWIEIFDDTQLDLLKEVKTTPFVSTFTLVNNGDTN